MAPNTPQGWLDVVVLRERWNMPHAMEPYLSAAQEMVVTITSTVKAFHSIVVLALVEGDCNL